MLSDLTFDSKIGSLFGHKRLAPRESMIEQSVKHKQYAQTMPSPEYTAAPRSFTGIEVEIENLTSNEDFGDYADRMSGMVRPWWNIVQDYSLRNGGVEFVSVPIRGSNIAYAIKALNAAIDEYIDEYDADAMPQFTYRTSLHIHIDVRTLTIENVISFMLLYMMVEDLIFAYVNKKEFNSTYRYSTSMREGNIYCTPITSAYQSFYLFRMLSAWKSRKPQQALECFSLWKKYSAFNVSTIAPLGTIEFRHMFGTTRQDIIIPWINIIQRMKSYAKRVSLNALIANIKVINTTSSYDMFLEHVFAEDYSEFDNLDKHIFLEQGAISIKSNLELLFTEGHMPTFEVIKSSSLSKFIYTYGYELVKMPDTTIKSQIMWESNKHPEPF